MPKYLFTLTINNNLKKQTEYYNIFIELNKYCNGIGIRYSSTINTIILIKNVMKCEWSANDVVVKRPSR